MRKAKVKRLRFIKSFLALLMVAFFLFPAGSLFADDTEVVPEQSEQAAPKSELDNLKAEWEAVREQQIQMIREKEDQLEKLKEEIFAKMKASEIPAAPQPASDAPVPVLPANTSGALPPGNSSELEAQKAALQAERQKFFREMSRQKESLRQLQASLDEKAKQLEADRARFEQEKKTAAS